MAVHQRLFVSTAVLLLAIQPYHAWISPVPCLTSLGRSPLPRLRRAATSDDTPSAGAISKEQERSIYSYPALYDIAFGYRDFEEEVNFLLQAHRSAVASSDKNDDRLAVLELAAGPARHALEALQNDMVESVTCIDRSLEMKEHAEKLFQTEYDDGSDASQFRYLLQDMRSFDDADSTTLFDTAWILLGSMQHLTQNQDVVDCFRSVHKALKPGGTLILELPHPRELFGMIDCTRNEWTVPLSQSETDEEEDQQDDDDEEEDADETNADRLVIVWGDEDDEFDPIRQVRQATVMIQRKGERLQDDEDDLNSLPDSVREVVPMRLFTAQEIDALTMCAGFRVVAMHGALQEDVSVDDEELAFRLVCVLQKQ